MNRLLKLHVKHQKNRLPDFVQQLFDFVTQQISEKKKAVVSVGNWRRQQSDAPQPQLSVTMEALQQSLTIIGIDDSILQTLWDKAAVLVHTEGKITRIPGDPCGRGRMVASTTTSLPHIVNTGKKRKMISVVINIARYIVHMAFVVIQ